MAFNNVPVNGWPQIKDLEKLNEIASQIENMPTFTSDDKEFLEDLPAYPETDGTKMLTATTTSGNTSLSYEDIPEELPSDPQSDGTRVLTATTSSGTTVKSWEAYQGMPNYSTTEQATGQKWIDGKDIYQKTEVFDTTIQLNPTSWTTVTSGAGMDKLLSVMTVGGEGTVSDGRLRWKLDNSNVQAAAYELLNLVNPIITFYYTKTA